MAETTSAHQAKRDRLRLHERYASGCFVSALSLILTISGVVVFIRFLMMH